MTAAAAGCGADAGVVGFCANEKPVPLTGGREILGDASNGDDFGSALEPTTDQYDDVGNRWM